MFIARMQRLQQLLRAQQLAAVVVNAGPTLYYLTGLHFHLMERPVVLVVAETGEPSLILPELEAAKLDRLAFPVAAHAYGENPASWPAVFQAGLTRVAGPGARVGMEPAQLRLLEYRYLQLACPEIELVDAGSLIARLRAVKDQEEIAAMRRAVTIAETALETTLTAVRVGVTEQEIAAELFLQLVRGGSDPSLPFAPIVAAGPNAANPHAQPSSRPLMAGDLLIVDWGASFTGYVSDLTRTFAIGEPGKEAATIHQVVRAANAAGRAAGGPGVCCATVDRAARRIVEEAGYGRFFPHRTGHGLGLECHEEPYLRGDNDQLLAAGMTYTVEPGIYLPGRNGVRIEDDLLVTAVGAESLSTMSRELRILE